MELLRKYELYIMLEQGLSANSREAYLRDVRRFTDWAAEEGVAPAAATLPTLRRYVASLHDVGIAPRSVARMVSGLRSFYRYLQLDGYVEQDPTELLESPQYGHHLPDVLTLEEVDALLAAIDTSLPEGRRDHAVIELLYSCGLRVSELCALRLSDLYLDDGFLRVMGKGSKQRIVPVSPRAVGELHEWFACRDKISIRPGEADYVFVSARRGRHLSRITVFHNIKVYAERAGIAKTISPHTFRHTFATHLLEGGASLRAIQAMLGHESLRTTEVYTHLDRRFLRRQVLEHFPRNLRK